MIHPEDKVWIAVGYSLPTEYLMDVFPLSTDAMVQFHISEIKSILIR
jgi:hypothetical protein